MDKKRYFQIDFAKAIGIFLVVLSHVIFFNKDLGKGLKLFNSFINAFHMPLFFIISGLNLGLSKSTGDWCAFTLTVKVDFFYIRS